MAAVLTVSCAACGHGPTGRDRDGAANAACVRATETPRTVSHSPRAVFSWRDPAITESSGLAVLPHRRVASIDDAGNPAVVTVVDRGGHTVSEVRLAGATNHDWEDLAVGRDARGHCHLWVADTGDAYLARKEKGRGPRTTFAVLKADLPRLGRRNLPATVTVHDVTTIPVVYPDGRGPNAEALLAHPRERELAVVTKGNPDHGAPVEVWSVPTRTNDGRVTLRQVGTLDLAGVSGGAWSPDGSLVALRDATAAYVWRYTGDLASTLAVAPVEIRLPRQPQGEAVAFSADGRSLLVSTEGAHTPVWRVPLPRSLWAAPSTSRKVVTRTGG